MDSSSCQYPFGGQNKECQHIRVQIGSFAMFEPGYHEAGPMISSAKVLTQVVLWFYATVILE